MSTTVVFGGGPTETADVRSALDGVHPDRVVAADSGLVACVAAGLHCDLVVGDMDSVPEELLETAAGAGTLVERHDSDKDATDLELALDRAVANSERNEVVVIASSHGRLDHLLATATIIGSPRYASSRIVGFLGRSMVLPVHDRRTLTAAVGTTATLLALHGPARGVTTTGLRWSLQQADLDACSTVGVSNVFEAQQAEVQLRSGVLTVVLPDEPDQSGV